MSKLSEYYVELGSFNTYFCVCWCWSTKILTGHHILLYQSHFPFTYLAPILANLDLDMLMKDQLNLSPAVALSTRGAEQLCVRGAVVPIKHKSCDPNKVEDNATKNHISSPIRMTTSEQVQLKSQTVCDCDWAEASVRKVQKKFKQQRNYAVISRVTRGR